MRVSSYLFNLSYQFVNKSRRKSLVTLRKRRNKTNAPTHPAIANVPFPKTMVISLELLIRSCFFCGSGSVRDINQWWRTANHKPIRQKTPNQKTANPSPRAWARLGNNKRRKVVKILITGSFILLISRETINLYQLTLIHTP